MPIEHGDSGVEIQTLDEIIDETKAAFHAPPPDGFGPAMDVEPPEPLGLIVHKLGEREASLHAVVLAVQNAARPSSAVGTDLDELLAQSGLERDGAVQSTIALRLGGTGGLALGTAKRVRFNPNGTLWAIPDNTVIGGGGTVDVEGTAVNAGPVNALTGTDWTIVTEVSGWTTVQALADAELGQLQEGNESARRKLSEQRSQAPCTLEGARAKIIEILKPDGLIDVRLRHNPNPAPTADGLPPGYIGSIFDGCTDSQIVAAMWRALPIGFQTWGAESAAVVDSLGTSYTLYFDRVNIVTTWVRVTFTDRNADYPTNGNALVIEAVAGWDLSAGDDPVELAKDLEYIVADVLPRRSFRSMLIEFSTDGVSWSSPPTIGPNDRADLDSARVVVP